MSESEAEPARPKASKADIAHALAKAAISEVPLIGMSEPGILEARTTELGKNFLKYIGA